MIKRTPIKPTAVALQRRQPTFSPRKIAAAAVTIKGLICRMALTSANGSRERPI